jgi:hypothetical protein
MTKREITILGLSNVIEWFKLKIGLEDDDPDLRAIECSLIRCMSDYRNAEISDIHVSDDFQARFLRALDQVEMVPEREASRAFWESRGFRYSMAFASFAIVMSFLYLNLRDPSAFQAKTAGALGLDPDLVQELREEIQLIDYIRNSDDWDSLKRLEEYYITHGITDRATRIHYSLETISR